MVIKNSPTGVRATLPRPSCHGDDLCPSSLYTLAVCPASPLCICQIVGQLAILTVPREVKLRNDDLPVFESGEFEGRKGVVGIQTCLEIFVPLTRDIIRDEDSGDAGIQGWDQG